MVDVVRRGRLAAVVAVGLLAGCASGQDPGLVDQQPTGPTTTSHTLGPCPPGGPDATTPPAGCLDANGQVLRP